MTIQTLGIILSVLNFGENDKKVWIYTPHHGKLEVFAKSARRLGSKLSPHIEPITLADCYIVRGKIDHLAGIERCERYTDVRYSMIKFIKAVWAAELVHRLTKPDHPEAKIFPLLLSWFSFIESLNSELIPSRYQLKFILKFFSYLGYEQEFRRCLRCKNETSSGWFFSERDGGIFCETCGGKTGQNVISLSDKERLCLVDYVFSEPTFLMMNQNSISRDLAEKMNSKILGEHLNFPLNADRFFTGISSLRI